jgi:hypothetical protein
MNVHFLNLIFLCWNSNDITSFDEKENYLSKGFAEGVKINWKRFNENFPDAFDQLLKKFIFFFHVQNFHEKIENITSINESKFSLLFIQYKNLIMRENLHYIQENEHLLSDSITFVKRFQNKTHKLCMKSLHPNTFIHNSLLWFSYQNHCLKNYFLLWLFHPKNYGKFLFFTFALVQLFRKFCDIHLLNFGFSNKISHIFDI